MKLSEFGITESPMDIRWRFFISCLKCEFDNYQPVFLEKSITHYLDNDAGRAAFELDRGQLRPDNLTTVSYYFQHQMPSDIKYNDLEDYQKELEELSLLLKGDQSWILSDAESLEDGEHYVEKERTFPDILEVFEITTQNASTLLCLLNELDLNTEFWVAAIEVMRDTLTRHTCEHDWSDDECKKCEAVRNLEEY